MDKHLIALDLDGTLLNRQQEISPKTKRILQYLMEEGHEVMIATGRPPRASMRYYEELGLSTPMVNFNSAYVSHPLDANFPISHSTIDLTVVHELIETLENYRLHNVLAEKVDDVYFHTHDKKMIEVFLMGNPDMTIGDLRTNLKESPTAIMIHAEDEDCKAIRHHLTLKHGELLDHRTWAAPWNVIEVIRKGVSKADGVSRVAEYLQVKQTNVIAFGDEDNDLEMLQWAGTGVAMGNGLDLVKKIANTVTLTNEEEGVAEFLIEYFNIPSLIYEQFICA